MAVRLALHFCGHRASLFDYRVLYIRHMGESTRLVQRLRSTYVNTVYD